MRVVNNDLKQSLQKSYAKNAVTMVCHAVSKSTSYRGAVVKDDRTGSLYFGIAQCAPAGTDCRLDKVLAYVDRVGPWPASSDGCNDPDRMYDLLLPYIGVDPAVYFHIDEVGNVTATSLVIETQPLGIDA